MKRPPALCLRWGVRAVKVEAFPGIADTIAFLVDRGIPVVGHVGIRPQAINVMGGFKVQGKSDEARKSILEAAIKIEKAGAFSIVLEGVPAELASEITQQLSIPTIGIGASKDCDGQILVLDDMLGMFDWTPKFVRRYANLYEVMEAAVGRYEADVRGGTFPCASETYSAS